MKTNEEEEEEGEKEEGKQLTPGENSIGEEMES